MHHAAVGVNDPPDVHRSAQARFSQASTAPPLIPDHELLRRIGGGSYGEVWMARTALGAFRAVKIVYRAQFELERPFEREFHGIQKFEPISRQHEGLVDILHVGRGEGCFYYVMELADDGSCEQELMLESKDWRVYAPRTLRAELQRRGRIPVQECMAIACTLTDALGYLHRHGLVHRDIKPSNIIFVGGTPKLADIGLVADIGEARSFVGTAGFIPPEGPGTPQADLYSLGKVLYEISTGKDRQEFPLLPPDLRDLPEAEALVEFNEIVIKACDANPKHRYHSAEEMRADLALLQGGRSVHHYRLIERRLAMLTRAGLVTALLLIVASGLFWGARTQARNTARQLYAADLNLAMQAWENGNMVRVHQLLERQRRNRSVQPGFEWRLLQQLCRDSEPRLARASGQGNLWQLAWSPDGHRLFSAGANGTVAIWDTATGRNLATLTNHAAPVSALALSPDGQSLATGGRDCRVLLWNLRELTGPRVFREHKDTLRSAAFSPDGALLATGSEDGQIVLRDPGSGEPVGSIQDTVCVDKLAFSPDSRILAAFGSSTQVRFWNVASRQRLTVGESHKAILLDGAFAPDGKRVATAGYEGTVKVWDLEANRQLFSLGRGAPTRVLAYSPDGQWLAVASDDNLVRLWEADSGQLVSTLRGHAANVMSLAFAPDCRTLATGSEDGTLRLWTLSRLPELANVLKHASLVNSIAFSRDASRLLTTDDNTHALCWWDVAQRRQLDQFTGPDGSAWCVALTRDARTAAVGGTDHNVRLWDLATRQTQLLPRVHEWAVECLALSPDDRLLATGGRDGRACLWDMSSRRLLHAWPHGNQPVRSVAFSPDGIWLATGGSDGQVKFWTTTRAQPAGLLDNHTREIRALAFSRDGRLLAAGGANCLVVVWDVRKRLERMRLEGHTAQISSLAFSPDGRTLASGSWDSTVKLWRVELGHELVTLREHTGQVTAVAFTQDGATLASASADGTVRLWETLRR